MGFEKYVTSLIDMFCDNQCAMKLWKNAVCHKRSKHIDISHHFTRKLVERKEITIRYLQISVMPADVLTKILPRCRHLRGECWIWTKKIFELRVMFVPRISIEEVWEIYNRIYAHLLFSDVESRSFALFGSVRFDSPSRSCTLVLTKLRFKTSYR